MNVATTKPRKVREVIDAETRAELIRTVRECSAFVGGKRETLRKTSEIAKEFGVRRAYVTNALRYLRARDAEAEEEIIAAMREAATVPGQHQMTQQELIAQFNAGFVAQPSSSDVVEILRSVETKVMLALDRLDRLATDVARLNKALGV